jgi:hypothetical protein
MTFYPLLWVFVLVLCGIVVDPDPVESGIICWICIRNDLKSWIRIWKRLFLIHNTAVWVWFSLYRTQINEDMIRNEEGFIDEIFWSFH